MNSVEQSIEDSFFAKVDTVGNLFLLGVRLYRRNKAVVARSTGRYIRSLLEFCFPLSKPPKFNS